MPRVNWKKEELRVTSTLHTKTWYRSPLWADDHLLGVTKHFRDDGLAWCGRPLDAARDYDQDNQLGGLFLSERKSGKCSECNKRQKEWEAR